MRPPRTETPVNIETIVSKIVAELFGEYEQVVMADPGGKLNASVWCKQAVRDIVQGVVAKEMATSEQERFRRLYLCAREKSETLRRSNAALRGVVTKLKARLNKQPEHVSKLLRAIHHAEVMRTQSNLDVCHPYHWEKITEFALTCDMKAVGFLPAEEGDSHD